MAGATMLARNGEPEVARFIDTYKFDQQKEQRREQFGGGTSLPLDSDGYNDKQRQLRDERVNDFQRQQDRGPINPHAKRPHLRTPPAPITYGPQSAGDYEQQVQKMTDRYNNQYNNVLFKADHEKPRESVYYRVGTPERGLQGLGQHENLQHQLNVERQREYNDFQKKQRAIEEKKFEARRAAPNRPAPPQGPQMDYNAANDQARADERRSYQDAMKAKQERDLALRGRPVTPPGGLNIGNYDRKLKEEAPAKQKEYKKMLDMQKLEQLKLRAYDRYAEVSPKYMKYRDEERPLVGSPRHINHYMHENKEKKEKFRKDLIVKPKRDSSPPNNEEPAEFIPHSEELSGAEFGYKTYLDMEKERIGKQRLYRDELLKQQKEQAFARMRQEPEVPVLERRVQGPPPSHLASKPPPGPSYRGRPEDQPTRQTPSYWNEGKPARSPLSLDSEDSRGGRRVRSIENTDVPLAFRTSEQFAPAQSIPERPHYGQHPHPGSGLDHDHPRQLNQMTLDPRSPPKSQRSYTPPRSRRRSPIPPRSPLMDPNMSYEPSIPRSPKQPPKEYIVMPRRAQNSLISKDEEMSDFNQKRRLAGVERQRDYNEFMKQKTEQEHRHHESLHQGGIPAEVVKNQYYSSDAYENYQKELGIKQSNEYRDFLSKQYQPPPGRVGLPLGQYQYEPKRLSMEAERNREYNDLRKKEEYKTPPGNPMGFPIGQYKYEPKRLAMEKERNKDYNEMVQKGPRVAWSAIKGPQGLNIDINKQKRKNVLLEKQRNKEYNEFLSKVNSPTQTGAMSQRADIPDLHTDNIQRYGAPQTQRYDGPDETRSNPDYHHHVTSYSAPPMTSGSVPATPSKLSLDVGHYDQLRPAFERERNREYNELKPKLQELKHKGPSPADPNVPNLLPVGRYDSVRPLYEQERNQEYNQWTKTLPAMKNKGMTPIATSLTLPVGQYDLLRPYYEKERNDEYNALKNTGRLNQRNLRDKLRTPQNQTGLPIGQMYYEPLHRAMEVQRNREYNEFLATKNAGTQRTSRSEPDPSRGKQASVYFGNDQAHFDKKRHLEQERHTEYNQMMREQPAHSTREGYVPSDVDSGLPIGQTYHNTWQKFLRNQRKQEYNDLKNQSNRNRNWNFDQNGFLEMHGDDDQQNKQRQLNAERKREYNDFIHQMKSPPNNIWPAPEGRGALLVKKGEYDGVRKMYDQERKKDYIESLEHRQPSYIKMQARAYTEPSKIRHSVVAPYYDPMVNNMGRYEEVRQRLLQDRKQEYRHFMDKLPLEDRFGRRYSESLPSVAGEERPLVNAMGQYETGIRRMANEERKRDFASFSQEQHKRLTPRFTVKENMMPHIASAETPLVNHMGSYDLEKTKIRQEQNRDLRDYSEKKKLSEKEAPHKNYVFPTVAVAEKPVVDYMGLEVQQRKQHLKDERKRDYDRHMLEQKQREPPRRHDYIDSSAQGPYNGLFNGLGEHSNQTQELNNQRRQEYNDRQDQQFAHKERPSGRPTFAKESIPNNTDRGRSPQRNPPVGGAAGDQYQMMLEDKRRNEHQRRRFDDHDFNNGR